MQQAEAKGDVAMMQAIAAKEQAARDAFYMPDGLANGYVYYHTIDRIFTSFPEIVFAGGKQDVIAKAYGRVLRATQNATSALSS